jgi:hypothetical protein
MAKKKAKKKAVIRKRKGAGGFRAGMTSVTCPEPGTQDCFDEGTPFIAFGNNDNAYGGPVIVSAQVVVTRNNVATTYNGTLLSDADKVDNGGKLTGYPNHDSFANPDAVWAFAFPSFDGNGGSDDLPESPDACAFIVNAADGNGPIVTVVPFEHESAQDVD